MIIHIQYFAAHRDDERRNTGCDVMYGDGSAFDGRVFTLKGSTPLLVALGVHILSRKRRFWLRLGSAAVPFVACSLWSALSVPTICAAVVVLIDAGVNPAPVNIGVGSAGCVLCLLPSLAVVVMYARHKPRGGHHLERPSQFRSRRRKPYATTWCSWTSPLLFLLRRWLLERRSAWKWTTTRSALPFVHRWMRCALVQLVEGAHWPHSWVVVYDAVCVLVHGALLGVASSAHASCGSIERLMWATFALTAAQACVACVVRPRATVVDCVFEIVMCSWTTAGTLLAALGVDEESAESSVAQIAASVIWLLPVSAVRLRHHLRRLSSSQELRPDATHINTTGSHLMRKTPTAPSDISIHQPICHQPNLSKTSISYSRYCSADSALLSILQHICQEKKNSFRDLEAVAKNRSHRP